MPKIPIIESEIAPDKRSPNVRANPGMFDQEYAAVQGVFAKTEDAAINHLHKLRSRERAGRLLQVRKSWYESEREWDTTQGTRQGSDAQGLYEESEKFSDNFWNEYKGKGLDENENLKIEEMSVRFGESFKNRYAAKQAQQINKASRDATDQNVQQLAENAYRNYQNLMPALEDLEYMFQDITEGKILSPEQAAGALVEAKRLIAVKALEGLTLRNPELAVKEIKSGIYDELLGDRKDDALNDAKKAVRAEEAWLKSRGAIEEKKRKEELERKQDEADKELALKAHEGVLTGADVKKYISILEPNRFEHFLKEIDKQGTKEDSKYNETDEELYHSIIDRIDEGEKVENAEINSYAGKGKKGGLSNDDIAKLKIYRDKPQKSIQVKLARKMLNKAKTDRIFNSGKSAADKKDNLIQWAENRDMLEDFIENNPDDDPQEFVREILKPVEGRFISDILKWGQPAEKAAIEEKYQGLKQKAEGMPDPVENKGKIIRDTDTGKRYKSDGKKWVEIK